ncbi:3,4-dihydroxy-2-butanone 4-phosphate synthase-domain-containing protein [Cantharellus anzutake]|uniref:3,4-dihydroxy-2-butanone 4-phosphate synthase-domain-containing protein n=1 Tax=Cantharellus anzutake TaxID=1750568 RepID=UPI0019054816|nr:3,4-dihydroxy-2-butanone 4-phosphate synthase-domain-containing protein [Cantharellus anzutake]KAF8329474.1 3,4-dihydroxy-2-butanone 4-phosphate synthase-domain-containing protein [Cantharellus anzutake]
MTTPAVAGRGTVTKGDTHPPPASSPIVIGSSTTTSSPSSTAPFGSSPVTAASISSSTAATVIPLVNGISTSATTVADAASDSIVPTSSSSTTLSSSSSNADESFTFDTMEEALEAFKRGEFLVVMDDEARENEGDLIISAANITTEQMAWFIKVTSGFICISLPGERLDELELPMMVAHNMETFKTAYTITVDYAIGTTTGISAHDRALTARKLAQGAPAHEFNRPGHLVPLRAREGGTLTRKGHTEAAVDLCRLTGSSSAGLLCELVNDDPQGTMARRNDCRAFANKYGLKMISVEMIAEYKRRKMESG